MKLLVVRNFRLRYSEIGQDSINKVADFAKLHQPDVIIMAGNISQYEKRSLIFAEQIAEATSLPVLYNMGILECCNLVTPEFTKEAIRLRCKINQDKNNVYWAEDYISNEVEFKCAVGWPIVEDTQENYKASFAGRWLVKERSALYVGDELLAGAYPKVFSVDEFNQRHLTEQIPEWTPNKKHVLLTSIDQVTDDLLTVKFKPANSYGEDISISASGEQLSIVVV